ncbi:MAG: sodium:calcium antiporter [Proteobacteria bacterium]|nr:sodium:calcium antiporter [Pseudomonadota bacterium]
MNPSYVYLLFGAGVLLLAIGGEGVIRGGVNLKRALGFSPVIVGLFAISIGTASPTLAVALRAATWNMSDVVFGTVVGATMINLLLILGFGALIRPMPSAPKVVIRDGGAMLAAAVALGALAVLGGVGRREGVILVGAFAAYSVVAAITDWRRSAEHSVACAEAEKRSFGDTPSVTGGLFALIVGAVCLLLGAHFAVGSALHIGQQFGFPPVAVATGALSLVCSLPVLLITWIAAARGHTQIAIGHLITSSVFNVFGALGIAAIAHPLVLTTSLALPAAIAVFVAVALLLVMVSTSWRLTRLEGAVLALAYFGFLGYTAWHLQLLPPGLLG